MKPGVKNFLSVIGGILLGNIVNMSIILIAPFFVTNPEGMDPNNIDSIRAHFHEMSFGALTAPFLAHAVGTLFGAILTGWVAFNNSYKMSSIVAFVFFIGGLIMAVTIQAPVWYSAMDLILAYFPMGILGCFIGLRLKKK